jgi:orotidine-5'-phosphate decarboxylase/LysM repeat protein
VAVKPQSACFETLGADGIRALEEVCDYAATAGLLVLLDAKRGDIGHTARAYASAYLEPRDGARPLADAMTVNAYLGRDSLDPFVTACRRTGGGIFCLVKTSNPGGEDVQDLTLSDGSQVWQHVARLVAEVGRDLVGESGLSSIGAVVGATFPRAVSEARSCCRSRSCSCPGSVPRARPPPTWRGRSRAALRARSSPSRAPSSTRSASRATTGARRPAQRRHGSVTRSGRRRDGEPSRRGTLRGADRLPGGDHGGRPAHPRRHGRRRGGTSRPATCKPVATQPAKPAARFYVVRTGDTLGAIAPRFDMTEAELVELNPGIEPTALRIGQKIRVR